MKLKLFIIAISLFVADIHKATACYSPDYQVDGYTMFRAVDKVSSEDAIQQNCLSWQRITCSTIPLDDIYQVVYKYSLEELLNIPDSPADNEFSKWISKNKDTEILAYLTLAKECEIVRYNQRSPWYYACEGDDIQTSLQDIALRAIQYNGTRFKDRYALQYIRAAFSLDRYSECISYWKEKSSSIQEGVICDMINGYIAGAYARVGEKSKALEYFIKSGDVDSALAVADKAYSEIDILKLIYQHTPNSYRLMLRVQNQIQSYEVAVSDERESDNEYLKQEKKPFFEELKQLALQIAREGRTDNPAMWYYTAAFISDLYDDIQEANKLLLLAEKAVGNSFIDNSIKVFRIYIDAKRLPYNASYDTLLYNQLEWLSLMVDANLTDEAREKSMFRLTMLGNYSYYYWNDMLRRIVLGEICPRMLKLGKTTKAIQLANMAEYRLLNKINYAQDTTDPYNREYATNLFDMVDTLDVNKVVDYTAQMGNSSTRINRFYKEGSYVDSNYWNDIIGTKYIRDGRYKEAIKYLSKVSPQFENTLNTARHMRFNPFSLYKEKIDKPTSYKLKFAKRMYELECLIAKSSNVDDKAEYMIEYAIGLRNSHTICWPLTYYYFVTTQPLKFHYKSHQNSRNNRFSITELVA
ncbi:MAG: hypothetical protein SNH27_14355 [Rikenellaceae bacterium]